MNKGAKKFCGCDGKNTCNVHSRTYNACGDGWKGKYSSKSICPPGNCYYEGKYKSEPKVTESQLCFLPK